MQRKPPLPKIFTLALWLYVALFAAFYATVDKKSIHIKYLNKLKGVEQRFETCFINGCKDDKLLRKARLFYYHLTRLYPTSPLAWQALGMIEYSLNNFSRAVKAFEKASRLDEQFVGINYNLALLYNNLGQHQKACQMFDITLKTNPVPTLQYPVLLNPFDKYFNNVKNTKIRTQKALDVVYANAAVELMSCRNQATDKEILDGQFLTQHLYDESILYVALADYYIKSEKLNLAMNLLSAYLKSHPRSIKALKLLRQSMKKIGQSQKAKSINKRIAITQDSRQKNNEITLPDHQLLFYQPLVVRNYTAYREIPGLINIMDMTP